MNGSASFEKDLQQLPSGINAITISGYKSLFREQKLEIRPLTILAGANSSGKSSVMQPLLLLKQTLEATYDPGALKLDGPNVRFTSADQLLSRIGAHAPSDKFSIGIEGTGDKEIELVFSRLSGEGFEIDEMKYFVDGEEKALWPGMAIDEITQFVPDALELVASIRPQGVVHRERCFLTLALMPIEAPKTRFYYLSPAGWIEAQVRRLVHLSGSRGNPERTYPTTAVGVSFPGLFQNYVASIIAQWKSTGGERLETLGLALERLGLTWMVDAVRVNDTQVELLVGRLPRGGERDLVSIADVGFGVSQALPVVVALLAAEPGQIVYLEQPELHLHPRAQLAMAELLAEAAIRGVKVVAETHSALLLLGVQALVAEGKLSPDLVKLHWFTLTKDGSTEIQSADLDETGAFGDWPEDFGRVELEAESRYLDAALR